MDKIEIQSNNIKNIVVGELLAKYSADGTRILRYYIDLRHKILDFRKELSAPELFILQNKVDALLANWDKKFAEHQKKSILASGKTSADALTIEASNKLDSLSRLLSHTLKVDDRVNWEALKDLSIYDNPSQFSEKMPSRRQTQKPVFIRPSLTFWDTVFGRKRRKLEEAYQQEIAAWVRRKEEFEKAYAEGKSRVHLTFFPC